jgi:NitT/TauT family transport system substrate-binding protein
MNNKTERALKRKGNVSVFTMIAVLALVLVTSCSKKPADAAVVKEPFRIFYKSNVLSVPLVTIAKERHYFEDEGLEPEYIILTSGEIEALSIGKADIMLTGIIPALSYGAQGADVRIVGGTASGGNFVVCKRENAAELKDLKNWRGKRLGTVRLSTSEMVSRYSLGQLGLDLSLGSKDITFVEIDSYPNIIEAVRKGTTDVGFVDSSYRQSLNDLGLEILFPMTYMFPNYVCCRQTANATALAERRGAFVKYFRAIIRAYKDYLEDREEVIKFMAKLSSQEESFVRDYVYNTENNANRIFNPDPDLKRVSYVYETLKRFDYVEKKGIEAQDIVDSSVYKDALNEILAQYPNEAIYKQLAKDFAENNGSI